MIRVIKEVRAQRELCAFEAELINRKAFIEKLRLEPHIIYSPFVDNHGTLPEENKQITLFREAVSQRVQQLEYDRRAKEIEKLEPRFKK